jgi:hypothetical protein
MKRKLLSFLVILLLVSPLAVLQFVPSVKASPTVATVGTSTVTNPVVSPSQKKTFFCSGNNRWYGWYSNGTRFGWETSLDGIDWTGAFTAYGAYGSAFLDLWYDEPNNKICLVRTTGAPNVYYRQGTANADGTITWDSGEVTVSTDSAGIPRVCKDSNGYPWVSYTGTLNNEQVVKATTTTGSSWGSATTLWTNRAVGSETNVILPLTLGKMLAISSATGYVFQSRLFDTSTWAAAVNASTSLPYGYRYFDAVADGDDVHLVFAKKTSVDIIYVKYVYGTGWGNEETVETACLYWYNPAITFKSADKVRVFYLKSATTIKYRDRDVGSWQDAVTISSTETSMTCLSSSYQAFSSKFCVTWKSGTSSPYNVRFECYTITAGAPEERSYTFTETMKPSSTLYQWQEHSRTFIETVILTVVFNQWQEHSYAFQQTITPTESITYWQEHRYVLIETITPSDILNLWQEQILTFIETAKPVSTSYHWVEGAYLFFEYTFTETIHPSATLNYWQEQVYSFIETINPSATLSHWVEGIYQFFEYTFTEPITPSAILNYSIERSTVAWLAVAILILICGGILGVLFIRRRLTSN